MAEGGETDGAVATAKLTPIQDGSSVVDWNSNTPQPPVAITVTSPTNPSAPRTHLTCHSTPFEKLKCHAGVPWNHDGDTKGLRPAYRIEIAMESDSEECESVASDEGRSLHRLLNPAHRGLSVSNDSLYVSDDESIHFLPPPEEPEHRRTVDASLAVPAPVFTVSVHYDGQSEEEDEEWNSAEEAGDEGGSEYEDFPAASDDEGDDEGAADAGSLKSPPSAGTARDSGLYGSEVDSDGGGTVHSAASSFSGGADSGGVTGRMVDSAISIIQSVMGSYQTEEEEMAFETPLVELGEEGVERVAEEEADELFHDSFHPPEQPEALPTAEVAEEKALIHAVLLAAKAQEGLEYTPEEGICELLPDSLPLEDAASELFDMDSATASKVITHIRAQNINLNPERAQRFQPDKAEAAQAIARTIKAVAETADAELHATYASFADADAPTLHEPAAELPPMAAQQGASAASVVTGASERSQSQIQPLHVQPQPLIAHTERAQPLSSTAPATDFAKKSLTQGSQLPLPVSVNLRTLFFLSEAKLEKGVSVGTPKVEQGPTAAELRAAEEERKKQEEERKKQERSPQSHTSNP